MYHKPDVTEIAVGYCYQTSVVKAPPCSYSACSCFCRHGAGRNAESSMLLPFSPSWTSSMSTSQTHNSHNHRSTVSSPPTSPPLNHRHSINNNNGNHHSRLHRHRPLHHRPLQLAVLLLPNLPRLPPRMFLSPYPSVLYAIFVLTRSRV